MGYNLPYLCLMINPLIHKMSKELATVHRQLNRVDKDGWVNYFQLLRKRSELLDKGHEKIVSLPQRRTHGISRGRTKSVAV